LALANSNKLKMKTKFNGILTLLLAFVVQLTFAQEKTISGTVVDETNMPLPGATVLIKGTTTGASTDFDGKYSISANAGDVLTFSYVGYADQNITIGSSNTIDVTLDLDSSLEEVIIEAAYDIKKAKPLVNDAIATVSSETIQSRPNTNVLQTLQGQTAGLNITTGNGRPGAQSNILIRGVGSVNGATEPLFIIDGNPASQRIFKNINANDIASVSVLKDAGATAIYGNRGTNGVIIVTTKGAKNNSGVKFSYSGMTSISNFQANQYDLLNSKEELELERTYGTGLGANKTDEEIAALAQINTDWRDIFFRNAITQNHTLAIAAGGERTKNYTSIGFLDQEGVENTSSLKRFNLRNNLQSVSRNDRFKFESNTNVSYSENEIGGNPNSTGVNRNFFIASNRALTYLDPREYLGPNDFPFSGGLEAAPWVMMDVAESQLNRTNELTLLANLNSSYKLTKNITLNNRLGGNYSNINTMFYQPSGSFNVEIFAGGVPNLGDESQTSRQAFRFNAVNSINYEKTFAEKHTINAGLYTEYVKNHLRGFGYTANGLDIKTQDIGTGTSYISDLATDDNYVDNVNAFSRDSGLFSYFAVADYDYNRKYGIGGTIRRDASSQFTGDNTWGTFWSVSGRWNINQESFMENTAFNLLKLRGSYGKTGNQQLDVNNPVFPLDTRSALYATGAGYEGVNALVNQRPENEDLSWESTYQANIGLDFGLWNNRLSGTFDVYERTTEDLFLFQPVQTMAGISGLTINSDGELINSGFEASLAYDVLKNTDGFSLSVNGNVAYNKSEQFGRNLSTIEEGGKFNQYYAVRYAGVNKANGNLLFYDKDGNVTDNPNADTDRVFTDKNSLPDYQGAFGVNVDYKGFFLTTQFNWATGIDRFDFDYASQVDPTDIGTFRHSADLLNAWTPTNTNTDVPALKATNLNLGAGSTRFLYSADYLRMRLVSIGYNFKKDTLKRLKLDNLRVFANGENLLTFSKWNGYDVEGVNSAQNLYPTPRTFALGLEIGF
jgi:TonB-dependent starch-binding outer membrane protein SusC